MLPRYRIAFTWLAQVVHFFNSRTVQTFIPSVSINAFSRVEGQRGGQRADQALRRPWRTSHGPALEQQGFEQKKWWNLAGMMSPICQNALSTLGIVSMFRIEGHSIYT
jgi:hypothetical protein